jgi:hypothetical protein
MTNPPENLSNDMNRVTTWPASRIAAAVSTVLWLFMVLTGISGIDGVREQHVPGYPNDGQLRLYVVIPLVGLIGSAAILGFANRLPTWANRVVVGTALLTLLPVFMMFGGGV